MSQEKERNKNVVRNFMQALEQGDYVALEEHPGLYETRQRHPLWQKAFKDLKYRIDQMVVEGEFVATRLTASGIHIGPFLGAPPTGKELTFGALQLDQVIDGKIVKHWANADWVTVLINLGIMPPPPTGSKSEEAIA